MLCERVIGRQATAAVNESRKRTEAGNTGDGAGHSEYNQQFVMLFLPVHAATVMVSGGPLTHLERTMNYHGGKSWMDRSDDVCLNV